MIFNWNEEKNDELKKERNIAFEEIVFYIENGQVIDILENPKNDNYKNQKLYLINIHDYIYVVPFVDDIEKDERFLKTIFPSRKYTKKYLRKGEKNEAH